MTRLLFNTKGFEAAYTAFQQINFTAFDYNTIKTSMLNYIKQHYSSIFADFIETSEYIAILELFAYLADLNSTRLDLAAHENFLTIAERKRSVLQLAKLISYTTTRNLPARGLAKLTSITTTEAVFDANNQNLAGVTINWNDPDNANWKEQFLLVVNQVLKKQFGNVDPQDRVQKDDVLIERYELKNKPLLMGVIPYLIVTNSGTVNLELVPVILDQQLGFIEKRPENNSSFALIYATDGQGDNSDTTGFFVYTKQGTLTKLTVDFDGVTPNQTYDIEQTNINETDVWLNNINPLTKIIVDNETEQGIRSGEWQPVPLTNSQNLAFNNIKHRNKYEIETLENDQIRLVFGDGQLSDIPKGTFEVWFRRSSNNNDTISRTSITAQPASFTYQDENTKPHTLSFTFTLVNSLQNAFTSESLDQIRRAAPGVYFIQDRIVNFTDLNTFLLQDPSIVKLVGSNRSLAADPKYIPNHDPSETYENVKLFGNDGIVYLKPTYNSFEVAQSITATTLLKNHIEPLLSKPEVITLMKELVDLAGLPDTTQTRKFFRVGTTFVDETEQILTTFGEPTLLEPTPSPGSFPVGINYEALPDTWTALSPPPNNSHIVVERLLQGVTQQAWKISYTGRTTVFASNEMRFWNVNIPQSPPSTVVDFDTLRPNYDNIVIVKENVNQHNNPTSILEKDIEYIVVDNDTGELGLPDTGLPNIHQVKVFLPEVFPFKAQLDLLNTVSVPLASQAASVSVINSSSLVVPLLPPTDIFYALGGFGFSEPTFVARNSFLTGSGDIGPWTDITASIEAVIPLHVLHDISFNIDLNTIFLIAADIAGEPLAARSTDFGLTWTNATSSLPASSFPSSIDFGNGLWVMVTATPEFSRIFTSADTLVWTDTNELPSFGADVRYTNGRWLVLCVSGEILTSTNGTNWNVVSAFSASISGVAHSISRFSPGANQFMIGGEDFSANGVVKTSCNGQNWSSEITLPNCQTVHAIEHFDNNTYVAIGIATSGPTNAWFSTNAGFTWTQCTDPNAPKGSGNDSHPAMSKVGDIIFAGSVALPDGLLGTTGLTYTTDGSTWTPWLSPTNISSGLTVIRHPDDDGIQINPWTVYESDIFSQFPYPNRQIAFGADLWVVPHNFDLISISDVSGSVWTSVNVGLGSETLTGIVFGGGQFILCGQGPFNTPILATSPDGINWTSQTTGLTSKLQALGFNGSFYVVAGSNGQLATSPDGINWTSRISTFQIGGNLNDVTFGAGTWVVVGQDGMRHIATSPDGINWTQQVSPFSLGPESVHFANGLFTAVGASGEVATSPDGIVWTLGGIARPTTLRGVTFGNGKWVAVASDDPCAHAWVSTDAIVWNNIAPLQGISELHGVGFNAGLFVAAGTDGTNPLILTATL